MVPSIYDYEELINYKKINFLNLNEINDIIYCKKLYLISNICESINIKINYYLPKKSTDNKDFLDTISKVIINNSFNNNNIIRHDYITLAIILMINNLKLNENVRWINYEEYLTFQKMIINANMNDMNDNQRNEYIEY